MYNNIDEYYEAITYFTCETYIQTPNVFLTL